MKKLLTLLGLILVSAALVFSQEQAPIDSTSKINRYDPADIQTFLDGVIETHMKDKNIAGASMAFVQNGEIQLLKSYGYADLENKKEVDPSNSLFRIGSISKMFAWTSIMQLVQGGKISLDDDINTYLESYGIRIPDTYPEPITIKHLMSHTPGFEDLVIQLFVKDTALLLPLAEVLKDQIPARVRPPGTNASYSNHGTGMAALIVEKVSGLTFNEYVEQNILSPLKMNNTTFRQPLPEIFEGQMSKGYLFNGGEFHEQDFEFIPLAPVGAASATAADMARFMMMHLQLGQLDGAMILDSTTAALMQSPAHQHHPDVNPMRHGFMDVSQNGEAIIGHGGDTFWFHSLMALWPERNIGFFLSFNSQAGGGTYMDVLEAFCDRYFPEEVVELEAQTPEFLQKFTGTYEVNRYPHHDLFKISKLMSVAKFTGTEEGRLRMEMGDDVEYFSHLHNLTFRNVKSSEVIVFREDDRGVIEHIYIGGLPIVAFDRVEGLDTPDTQTMVFTITLAVIVLTFAYWTIMYFVRRRLDVSEVPADTLPAASKTLAWVTMLLVIIFYIGAAITFSNPFEVVYGIPVGLKVLLMIPFIIILLILIMAFSTWSIWKEGEVAFFGRIWYTVILLCLVATIWQLNYWNFLGWKY